MATGIKNLVLMCENVNRVINIIPHKAATIAVNFSKERFVKKNWVDKSEIPWKKTRKRKGSTLIKSGRLKRSIRKVHVGADYAVIGTDVPYAQPHNDGGTIEGVELVRTHKRRAHKRKAHIRSGKRIKAGNISAHVVKSHKRKYKRTFTQRRFIGRSQKLTDQIVTMVNLEIKKVVAN